jgi:hypothetical protein
MKEIAMSNTLSKRVRSVPLSNTQGLSVALAKERVLRFSLESRLMHAEERIRQAEVKAQLDVARNAVQEASTNYEVVLRQILREIEAPPDARINSADRDNLVYTFADTEPTTEVEAKEAPAVEELKG